MTDTMGGLRRKIASAGDLQSVVRTMKALAASSIGQYERSVRSLTDYHRNVELGLGACFRAAGPSPLSSHPESRPGPGGAAAVVFGSDQGLVGKFNEVVSARAVETLAALPGRAQVLVVGERVRSRLLDAGVAVTRGFSVPSSVETISPLVGEILVETEALLSPVAVTELHLFYNRASPGSGSGAAYAPVSERLLPLDQAWHRSLVEVPWPTKRRPEVLGGDTATLRALLREHVFISLFRACAESLSSENASRLAAMQRADKNIDDLLEELDGKFHRMRQTSIDEELFDVISGVEALSMASTSRAAGTRGGGAP